ncbi:hypothetical protein JB92DRAFT_1535106 [Gautieria morchelliformis]|nr:hypothetical protein JB92DRAFT_1535106 [Gautieria morchelliformis]
MHHQKPLSFFKKEFMLLWTVPPANGQAVWRSRYIREPKGCGCQSLSSMILGALAEKGEITQRAYAKTLVFVAKQAEVDEMPVETWEALESE